MHEFGYPDANSENILTDVCYKLFFESMLKENKGKLTKQVDSVIDDILNQIQ